MDAIFGANPPKFGGELPGLILSALLAGNQPLTWQESSAETAYKGLIKHNSFHRVAITWREELFRWCSTTPIAVLNSANHGHEQWCSRAPRVVPIGANSHQRKGLVAAFFGTRTERHGKTLLSETLFV